MPLLVNAATPEPRPGMMPRSQALGHSAPRSWSTHADFCILMDAKHPMSPITSLIWTTERRNCRTATPPVAARLSPIVGSGSPLKVGWEFRFDVSDVAARRVAPTGCGLSRFWLAPADAWTVDVRGGFPSGRLESRPWRRTFGAPRRCRVDRRACSDGVEGGGGRSGAHSVRPCFWRRVEISAGACFAQLLAERQPIVTRSDSGSSNLQPLTKRDEGYAYLVWRRATRRRRALASSVACRSQASH